MNYLIIERYILYNVRVNRDIFSLVFQIMWHAKTVNIVNSLDQLIWAYNVITFELIRDIDFFDENILIMTFFKNLEMKKDTWHRIYTRKLTS